MTAPVLRKSGRPYERLFDHEEARTRHAAGETIAEIARSYGVTYSAVWQAITPGNRQRSTAYHKRWRAGTCEDCGGPAMRVVSGKRQNNTDGRVLCRSCRSKIARTSVRIEDGLVVAVKCFTCDTWLDPDRFPKGKRYKDLRVGGFHNCCRSCLTVLRRDYRERHKIPCTNCGKPRLPQNEKNSSAARAHLTDSGLCSSCYIESIRVKRSA